MWESIKGCEGGVRPPPDRSAHHLDPYKMDRAIVELREDSDHERDRRYSLTDTVRNHRKGRATEIDKDRDEHAVAQL